MSSSVFRNFRYIRLGIMLVLSASLVLGTSLLPPAHQVCSVVAWATQVVHYGSDGRSGRDGRDGQIGRSGQSQTVVARGDSRVIDLSGRDGDRGGEGENGYRPYCHGQPSNVAYDLRAPDGGNGGAGGDGGRGGSGGDLTVYYEEVADLRQLLVDSSGGIGGRGGRGGQGAAGCNCRDRRWEQQVCTGTPGQSDYSCQIKTFICEDGDYGRNGRNGRDGEIGEPGQLYVVDQLEPLAADQPTQTLTLSALQAEPVGLSKNLWQTRQGALALLAPGSTLRNDYQAYVGRAEGQFQLRWEAPRPIADFAGDGATLTIEPDNQIQFATNDELWVEQETRFANDMTTTTISGIIRASEVTQLAIGNVSGRSNGFTVAVVDLAGQSDALDSQFRLVFKTSNDDPRDTVRRRFTTRYDGMVPAGVIRKDFERYQLDIGRLPISGQHLTPGTAVQIELQVTRSFAGRSRSQALTWEGEIRR
ncbi:MAG: collagen-like protein [Cyanobacteria bacterium P01_C01_bin.73]